ncbi:MAG: EexN family lipoprotein [Betaproteobacteria bacterium]|nr:EexN family lipoprotein [Betaproteobacteria bacterium]
MKYAFVALSALVLWSCEQTKTQDYYISHPAELAADLAECQRAGKNTFNCNEAAKAKFMIERK